MRKGRTMKGGFMRLSYVCLLPEDRHRMYAGQSGSRDRIAVTEDGRIATETSPSNRWAYLSELRSDDEWLVYVFRVQS